STRTTAASSASVGSPRTTEITGPACCADGPQPSGGEPAATVLSALRLADPEPELAMHSSPEGITQPLPGLLVGAQREAQLFLGVDQQFLVDYRRKDRAREQVPDVVLAAGQDPLMGDMLASLLPLLPVRAEPANRQVRDRHRPGHRP